MKLLPHRRQIGFGGTVINRNFFCNIFIKCNCSFFFKEIRVALKIGVITLGVEKQI